MKHPMKTNGALESLSKIGNTLGLSESVQAASTRKSELVPTRAKLRLVETAQTIKDEPPEMRSMLFLSTFLIQCTLPHKNPGDVPIWKRTNNEYTLAIQPGWDFEKDRSLGFPYGTLPRLLLIWIVTEAKRTGCRRLELGNSLTEFLRKLDLDPHSRGKARSDAVRLKDAIRRLLGCNIIFYKHLGIDGKIGGERLNEAKVAPNRELWWDSSPIDQTVLWGSWIELGADFFDSIMKSTVPCNMRAIRELRRSPLALDLYMLCNWIGSNLLDSKKKDHFISWQMLSQQLGGDYSDTNNLKKAVQQEMRKVKLMHPELKASCCTRRISGKLYGGVLILPSMPAIPKRSALA